MSKSYKIQWKSGKCDFESVFNLTCKCETLPTFSISHIVRIHLLKNDKYKTVCTNKTKKLYAFIFKSSGHFLPSTYSCF